MPYHIYRVAALLNMLPGCVDPISFRNASIIFLRKIFSLHTKKTIVRKEILAMFENYIPSIDPLFSADFYIRIDILDA